MRQARAMVLLIYFVRFVSLSSLSLCALSIYRSELSRFSSLYRLSLLSHLCVSLSLPLWLSSLSLSLSLMQSRHSLPSMSIALSLSLIYHADIFSELEEKAPVEIAARFATASNADFKAALAQALADHLRPIGERLREYEANDYKLVRCCGDR